MLQLRRQPHSKDDRFWIVLCEEIPVGAIVRPSGFGAWHWSIAVEAPSTLIRNGKAFTIEEASADLERVWDIFRDEIGDEAYARHVVHMAELAERVRSR